MAILCPFFLSVPSAVCKHGLSNIIIALGTPTYNRSPESLGSRTPTDAGLRHTMSPYTILDESMSSPCFDTLGCELHIYSVYPFSLFHFTEGDPDEELVLFGKVSPFRKRKAFLCYFHRVTISYFTSGSRRCDIPSPRYLTLHPSARVSGSIIITPRLPQA